MPIKIVFAIEIRNGQKISQHFAGKVLGLPTNDKLARSPRKEFCAASALHCPDRTQSGVPTFDCLRLRV
jgi:hypothetical protein